MQLELLILIQTQLRGGLLLLQRTKRPRQQPTLCNASSAEERLER
jgi:hypothetical protein